MLDAVDYGPPGGGDVAVVAVLDEQPAVGQGITPAAVVCLGQRHDLDRLVAAFGQVAEGAAVHLPRIDENAQGVGVAVGGFADGGQRTRVDPVARIGGAGGGELEVVAGGPELRRAGVKLRAERLIHRRHRVHRPLDAEHGNPDRSNANGKGAGKGLQAVRQQDGCHRDERRQVARVGLGQQCQKDPGTGKQEPVDDQWFGRRTPNGAPVGARFFDQQQPARRRQPGESARRQADPCGR